VRASGGVRIVAGYYFDTDGFRQPFINQIFPGGGSWVAHSDRNAKTNLMNVDERDILARLASIPIQTWSYKTQDPSIRHIGPMAQDFYEAFAVGETKTGIATVDADGVALAAIQGLNKQLTALQAQVTARDADIQDLRQQLAATDTRLKALESRVTTIPVSFIHRAEGTNIAGNVTYLSNPNTDNHPEVILTVTPNWNPNGAPGVYNDHAIGVYYTGTQWAIFNQDLAPIPKQSAFNVTVIPKPSP